MKAFDVLVYLIAELKEKRLPVLVDLYLLKQKLHFML